MEKQEFFEWLTSEAGKNSRLIGGATFFGWLSSLTLVLYNNRPAGISLVALDTALKDKKALPFLGGLAIIQAAVCFLLTYITPRPVSDNLTETQTSSVVTTIASKSIQIMVLVLYSFLGIYYSVNAFYSFIGLEPGKSVISLIIEIITATFIFFLYVVLSELTIKFNGGLVGQSDILRHQIVFTGVSILLITIGSLSRYYNAQNTFFVIRIIVGFISGVTLALVAGRLGSMYLNPGAITLSLIYLYAMIQPFAAYFHELPIHFLVTSIALSLKILLWLIFVWAFTTGRLWEYVREVRSYLEKRDKILSE